MPTDWLNFLRNSLKKCELIKSLTTAISTTQVEEGTQFVTTSDNSIISIRNSSNIPNCNLEETDTRVVIHALNAIQSGFKKIPIQTVDTDPIVLLVHHSKNFLTLNDLEMEKLSVALH